MAGKQVKDWENWSGSVRCTPREVATPSSIEQLQELVGQYGQAQRHLRVVGAGHSFTPLVHSDDMLMSLDALQGIEQVDKEQGTATVLGGTRLKQLGPALHAHGLA